MNKSFEPTLTGLIPGLVGPLPPELVQLAASLFAQSKTRISSLKSTEETARQYVCSHIACDRLAHLPILLLHPHPTTTNKQTHLANRANSLRKQLDLPPIEPRPPLAKKAYGALYNQFQKGLPTQTRPALLSTTVSSSSSTTPAAPPAPLSSTLNTQITTLMESLCAPSAHPHVVLGVTAMLAEDRAPKTHLPLVTAVALLVIEKLLPEGKSVIVGTAGKWRRGEGYILKRDGVMAALGGVGKVGFTKEDTDGWVKELSMRGIRELEWLRSVPDGVGLRDPESELEMVVGMGMAVAKEHATLVKSPVKSSVKSPVKTPAKTPARTPRKKAVKTPVRAVAKRKVEKLPVKQEEEEEMEEEEEEDVEPAPPPPKKAKKAPEQKVESGIGTFHQGSVDYLSEKKRKGYKEWEGRVRTRANELREKQATGVKA